MPDTTHTPWDEQKYSGLMAGLEIVDADAPSQATGDEVSPNAAAADDPSPESVLDRRLTGTDADDPSPESALDRRLTGTDADDPSPESVLDRRLTGTDADDPSPESALDRRLTGTDADDPSPESVLDQPPLHPPDPEPTVEHSLAPIQAMWDGTERRPPAAPAASAASGALATSRKHAVDKQPRRLLVVLPGLLVLGLLAACVSLATAAPLWLTVGHGMEGTVTVNSCDYSGCRGDFRPDQGGDTIGGVRITGDEPTKQVGASDRAQVTSDDAVTAYAGDRAGLWWRVGAGVVLLLGCGFGVAAVSGAWHWHGRERMRAVVTSFAAPLALFAAVFVLSW